MRGTVRKKGIARRKPRNINDACALALAEMNKRNGLSIDEMAALFTYKEWGVYDAATVLHYLCVFGLVCLNENTNKVQRYWPPLEPGHSFPEQAG